MSDYEEKTSMKRYQNRQREREGLQMYRCSIEVMVTVGVQYWTEVLILLNSKQANDKHLKEE